MRILACFLLGVGLLTATAYASFPENGFDLDAQLDALGREELMAEVPEEARELLRESGVEELSVGELLQLSPGDFFQTAWRLTRRELGKPGRTLGVIAGALFLTAMLGGLGSAGTERSLSQVFSAAAALFLLTAVVTPIFDCVTETSRAIEDASGFMLAYIPVFSAALVASGQPATGAAYNVFLFSACQVASQVVAETLIPLLGVYLAVAVTGVLAPELAVGSAAKSVRHIVSWGLGLVVTAFVGLLSVQALVSGSADGVTSRTAKFLIGSFVPVVGRPLSDAFTAAEGCLRLIKASVGVYGILAAAFVFLPVLLRAACWYAVTGISAMAGELLGVPGVSGVMKSCQSAIGILIAVILSFALLVIVSTAAVLLMAGK